jgi:hypothetical protein
MKNTAINKLEYTGTVTMSRYIGSKKVKIAQAQNAGKYPLFNFFSDCLLGDFDIARANRPDRIRLLSKTDENAYESRSGFIIQTNKPEKVYSESEGIVRYSFIITMEHLQGNTFNSIGLYNSSAEGADEFVASVQIPQAQAEQLSASLSISSALVIDWELHIANKE